MTNSWEEEARRYAQNADFWREKAESKKNEFDWSRCVFYVVCAVLIAQAVSGRIW